MSLPALTKTWHFNVNNAVAAQANLTATARLTLRSMKNAMLGTGSWTDSAGSSATPTNNWTVSGSSNTSTAGMDGTDRWAADSDLVWSNAATGSWIVLRQAQVSTKYEVLLYLGSVSNTNATIGVYVSPNAGFGTANGGTNGATNARPTATDEILVATSAAWGMSTSNTAVRWHVLKSSDGKLTRAFMCRDGFASALWSFEVPSNPVTGWSNPSIGVIHGASTAPLASSVLLPSAFSGAARFVGTGATAMALAFTGEAIRTSTAASELVVERVLAANDLSGEFPLYPIGLYSTTGTSQGRHGTVTDMWWGLTNLAESTTYPNDGSRQMCQFGNLVVPWNGTVPVFT